MSKGLPLIFCMNGPLFNISPGFISSNQKSPPFIFHFLLHEIHRHMLTKLSLGSNRPTFPVSHTNAKFLPENH